MPKPSKKQAAGRKPKAKQKAKAKAKPKEKKKRAAIRTSAKSSAALSEKLRKVSLANKRPTSSASVRKKARAFGISTKHKGVFRTTHELRTVLGYKKRKKKVR
jgi:hypothetical protein